MGFEHQTGGDVSTGGSWLADPGTYHLCITDVQETPTNNKGELISNAAFRVACTVCDGTVPNQKDKTVDITFFNPKSTDKNEGAMARKKLDRFFLAVGLATEQQIESKAKLSIDLQEANGRQFIAQLEKEKEDSKFLSLSFANLYHVDDPAVQAIPKDKAALNIIDPKLRRVGMQAAAKASRKEKAASKNGAATTTTAPTGVGAGAAADALNDL